MKAIRVFAMMSVVMLLASCGNEEQSVQQAPVVDLRAKLLLKIHGYEQQMHASTTLDPTTATLAVQTYMEFVNLFPNDSLCPDFLFKSGEISTANMQYSQALSHYQTITEKYPDYKLSPESLYLQAYLLDNFLNKDEEAKVIYEKVIEKYPALSYANDAKAAINNLGKTDEELIKEFKKKNK